MRRLVVILFMILALTLAELSASAQNRSSNLFKNDAFSQTYDTGESSEVDSSDVVFSFKQYFDGLGHKAEYPVEKVALGSAVLVGGMQIYNKDYWKLPLVYGTIGTSIGLGIHYNNQYNKTVNQGAADEILKRNATICFIGAGVAYWGTLMDGVISYKPEDYPSYGKAMMYSILLPGLGQIYNHEIWKLPIYWGGLAASYYFYKTNNESYMRFRSIYNQIIDPEQKYEGPYTQESALYYRNTYRRLKDYSLVAIIGVYLLQVIDANIFASMHGFDVNNDISLDISPAVITPDNAFTGIGNQQTAVGLSLGIRF